SAETALLRELLAVLAVRRSLFVLVETADAQLGLAPSRVDVDDRNGELLAGMKVFAQVGAAFRSGLACRNEPPRGPPGDALDTHLNAGALRFHHLHLQR